MASQPSSVPAVEPAIEMRQLTFAWPDGPRVLNIQELVIPAGQSVFLYGPSGCGKSTLLGLVAGVLAPQSGTLNVLGHSLPDLSAAQRDRFRSDQVGLIFQMFNLLPYLSVLANVSLASQFSDGRAKRVREGDARQLLARLGLQDPEILNRPVAKLSMGQQQRVAAARALLGQPKLLIADEPTSALDSDARDRFIELLLGEAQRAGSATLFVSHDSSLAGYFDRAIALDEINRP